MTPADPHAETRSAEQQQRDMIEKARMKLDFAQVAESASPVKTTPADGSEPVQQTGGQTAPAQPSPSAEHSFLEGGPEKHVSTLLSLPLAETKQALLRVRQHNVDLSHMAAREQEVHSELRKQVRGVADELDGFFQHCVPHPFFSSSSLC